MATELQSAALWIERSLEVSLWHEELPGSSRTLTSDVFRTMRSTFTYITGVECSFSKLMTCVDNEGDDTCIFETFYGRLYVPKLQEWFKVAKYLHPITLVQKSMQTLLETPFLLTRKTFLMLPKHVLVEFMRLSFTSHWFPLTMSLGHLGTSDNDQSIATVCSFLTSIDVFEVLESADSGLYTYIVSWMQHFNIRIPKFKSFLNRPQVTHYDDELLLVKPHAFSKSLIYNFENHLLEASKMNDFTYFVSAYLRGLKISQFLMESTEYDQCLLLTKTLFDVANLLPQSCCGLRLRYEALVRLLKCMNLHCTFSTPECHDFFNSVGPKLLKTICQNEKLCLKAGKVKQSQLLNLLLEQKLQARGSRFGSDSCDGEAGVFCQGPRQRHLLDQLNANFSHFSAGHVETSLGYFCDPRRPIVSFSLLTQLAFYHIVMCHFHTAYQFIDQAVAQFKALQTRDLAPPVLSPHVMVDFLRLVFKFCMHQREYDFARKIIEFAISLAHHHFGRTNGVYVKLLLEYTGLLSNQDKISDAVTVSKMALSLAINFLPGSSLLVAQVLEDMAYTFYVLGYSSGDFDLASCTIDSAHFMVRALSDKFSMQAGSACRVQALILEEMAIDTENELQSQSLLEYAKELHMKSRDMCMKNFGIWNVQTAKHFGNLGRLYQSLRCYEEAKHMHLLAIHVKEALLGKDDQEVGLSVGHLASLYTFDMEEYEEGEKLYLRSIQISLKQFGPSYSGLQYDLRGLQRVYANLGDDRKLNEYVDRYNEWCLAREEAEAFRAVEPLDFAKMCDYCALALDEEFAHFVDRIQQRLFKLCDKLVPLADFDFNMKLETIRYKGD